LSSKLAACAGRRFKFHKCRQLLIRTHNETLSVIAMRVGNPDYSPASFNGCGITQPNRLC